MNAAEAAAGGGAGDWAEVELVVLAPSGRATGLPSDTAATPLTARIRGFLEADATLGQAARVRTLAGRRVEGTLRRLRPAAGHSFGEPSAELLEVGAELRGRAGG